MGKVQLETTAEQESLRKAIASLGIDRPILKIEAIEDGLRLHLLGGDVVEWRASAQTGKPRKPRRAKADERGKKRE